MKLRNKILAMAVVAVAGFNAYLANGLNSNGSDLTLDNLENSAEAYECVREISHYLNGQFVYNSYVLCDASSDDNCDAGGSLSGYNCTGVKRIY